MLRQASHVVTRIVDGREYSTIGRAEWAALMAWQEICSGQGHTLDIGERQAAWHEGVKESIESRRAVSLTPGPQLTFRPSII